MPCGASISLCSDPTEALGYCRDAPSGLIHGCLRSIASKRLFYSFGASPCVTICPHGLRRGLQSFAASRLLRAIHTTGSKRNAT
jgi:hypothetical protein